MLADINDVMDTTGETYTDDQVWQITTKLKAASREIQKYTGQKLERQVHAWKPKFAAKLKIPQMPDVVITSIKDINANDVTYLFDGVEFIYVSNPSLIAFDYNPFTFQGLYGTTNRLTVVYEAGYDIIPADIKSICVQMAIRAYGSDPMKSGMTQESITNYSYQQGQAAAAGAIGMLPMETDSLEPYKRLRGPIELSA